jgi:hypothetical protein
VRHAVGADARAPQRADPAGQRLDAAVEAQLSAVDHQDPRAQGRDVLHVVGGQDHRRPVLDVVAAHELADRQLHRHVHPDRRLVEEQDPRRVQQRGDQLALHPLAEAQLAHRATHDLAHREQAHELIEATAVVADVDVEHHAVELEGVHRRQIPAQLALLPHDEADRPQELRTPLRRHLPRHPQLTRARIQQPGQHLQGRRLAGPVGPEEADALPRTQREAQVLHRVDLAVLPAHQRAQRRPQAGLAASHPKLLAQPPDLDGRAGDGPHRGHV